MYFLKTAINVNTAHNSTVDCSTVSCNSKITQTDNRFSGKFIMVPITVSVIASFHAALSYHVTCWQLKERHTCNMGHARVPGMSGSCTVCHHTPPSTYVMCNWL